MSVVYVVGLTPSAITAQQRAQLPGHHHVAAGGRRVGHVDASARRRGGQLVLVAAPVAVGRTATAAAVATVDAQRARRADRDRHRVVRGLVTLPPPARRRVQLRHRRARAHRAADRLRARLSSLEEHHSPRPQVQQ